ncbi:hypothetical protein DXG01_001991 [Tephrocybe rancida]|nr:hypothetical protein DXG01_001991 [Tephrocybe rancida]
MLPNEDRAMDLEQSLPEPEPNSSPVEAVGRFESLREYGAMLMVGSIQKNSPTSPVSPQKYAAVSLGPAEAHAKHLKKFLDAHLESIGSLRDALLRAPHTSLIVSFLSLVKSIVVDDHRVAFDVGMLLSCFAMSLHFGNIIVAGRGSALTSQHSTDDVGHDLAYFHHYLQLCEQLQFFATLMFLLSVAVVPAGPSGGRGSGQLDSILERVLEGVHDV